MKRFLSFLLVMLLTLSLLPISAMANTTHSEYRSASMGSAAPVQITKQPQDITVAAGETVHHTIEATGEGLVYRWYFRDPADATYRLEPDYNFPYYRVTMADKYNGRQLYCIVTDKYGNQATSNTVTMRMQTTPLRILTQPSNSSAPNGEYVKVTIKAAGDGLYYRWYYKDRSASQYVLEEDYNFPYYYLQMKEQRDGRQLYCIVFDKYGNNTASNIVTLRMAPNGSTEPSAPVRITKQPQDITVAAGETVHHTIEATGEGLVYRWYFRDPADATYRLEPDYNFPYYRVTMADKYNGRQLYCIVTDKYGNQATSNTVTMRMQTTPLRIITQPLNSSAPNGEYVKVTIEAAGDGLYYRWYYKDRSASQYVLEEDYNFPYYYLQMKEQRDGRQLYCIVFDKYGNNTASNIITLTLAPALTITQQPKSVAVANGAAARVTVNAAGEGLKYQWYVKMPGSTSYQKSSQTGTTYSVTMNDSRNGMKVCCKVTDKYGKSVTSEVATLSMAKALAITQQPKSVTVYNGETAKVTIQATGDGLTYQWYVKMPTSSSYQKGSQTGTTYSIKMTDARDGMKVCCKVTDKYGNSITSGVATLNQGTTLAITQQPKSVTVYNGETAKVTVKAAGDGLQYQWYVKMPTSSSYQKSSQTGTAYAVTMNDSRNGMKVCCKITDKYGRSVTSNAVTLSKNTALAITQQPKSVSVASGAAAKVTVKAVGEGLTYQWYVKMPTSSSYVKGSQTGTTYSVTMNSSRNGMKVCCKITDKYGKSVTSEVATLKQVTALTITQQPRSVTVAPGEAAKATVKASGEGLQYQWYVKMPTSSSYSKSSQTGATYSVAMNESRNGMMIFCKVTDKYSNSINSSIVTLKMATPLAITQQPKSVAVVIGSTARVTVKAVGDGLTYQWFYKNAGGTDFLTSSQTTATYSVKMTESCVGRQLCCMITDQYGNILISNTVTLKRG